MTGERASIERDLGRLATERTQLFERSGRGTGLSMPEQNRLRTVERELDECYTQLRRARAARDAARFTREDPLLRRVAKRRQDVVTDRDGRHPR